MTTRTVLKLKKPHVTEKATMLSARINPAYTFEVEADINKIELAKIIKEVFKVNATKINITNLPAKKVFVRGKWGTKSGMKKAIVYLKKGDKIDFA
ncbi:MAG: 50S ribosomal protein L23 [Parcubacteria group bacterium GW2011_GWF2_38_76]|nr:MAG: 50S ribosomal protein L23 [Parcubacteria group bacterium GW2011_GWF2_38_76]HBM45370.1 50S ribosomal protein L23 [Patescibacteria group bacterium]